MQAEQDALNRELAEYNSSFWKNLRAGSRPLKLSEHLQELSKPVQLLREWLNLSDDLKGEKDAGRRREMRDRLARLEEELDRL